MTYGKPILQPVLKWWNAFQTALNPPKQERTWRYVCEMNDFETYEAICELTAIAWDWRDMKIGGMLRPGMGYKSVNFKRSDLTGLKVQVFDQGSIVVWTSVYADAFPHSFSLDIARFNQYLNSINVNFNTDE